MRPPAGNLSIVGAWGGEHSGVAGCLVHCRWNQKLPASSSGLVDGVIVVDKHEGLTSHDVVNRMRRLANTRKVGHLGTLDPMATGVLPLVIGRATRLAQFYVRSDKVYDARVSFVYSTDTYDTEGTATSAPVDQLLD